MKTLIVYHSSHHRNSEKIALALADPLDAFLVKVSGLDPRIMKHYDLIGFGSGIYFMKHHKAIFSCLDGISLQDKKVFIFSTSGQGGKNFHKALRKLLREKGAQIVGEFSCKGFDTFGPLRFFGGINKGRPDRDDLYRAVEFARSLRERLA